MSIKSISERAVLNNGVKMPWLGLGVFKAQNGGEIEQAIGWAFEAGYRHIDTAAAYGNEEGVGRAVRESGIPREEIFITTKLANHDIRNQNARAAFETSLEKLDLDYVDLYLIHWPVKENLIEAWQVMEDLYNRGKCRSIGVSNFLQHHLEDFLKKVTIVPAVNQMEFHPRLVQPELIKYCKEKGILYEAWSPIMRGEVLNIPEIKKIAQKHGKTPVQIVLRWDLQHEVATIPKSINQKRIQENADIFDFQLDDDEMARLDALDNGFRTGPDPDNFNF